MPRKPNATMHQIANFQELLVHELQDLYSAELQIIESLPNLIKAATNPKLKEALKNHLLETREQVKRLDKMFTLLDEPKLPRHCKGMEGLIEENEELLAENMKSNLRDAAIIGAAQKIEHYEMGSYGTARAHAKLIGMDEIADLLKKTFDEEVNADKVLSKIADGTLFSTGVNKKAIEE